MCAWMCTWKSLGLPRLFDKLDMTWGRGQWPGVIGTTGQNQVALLLEKSVDLTIYVQYIEKNGLLQFLGTDDSGAETQLDWPCFPGNDLYLEQPWSGTTFLAWEQSQGSTLTCNNLTRERHRFHDGCLQSPVFPEVLSGRGLSWRYFLGEVFLEVLPGRGTFRK